MESFQFGDSVTKDASVIFFCSMSHKISGGVIASLTADNPILGAGYVHDEQICVSVRNEGVRILSSDLKTVVGMYILCWLSTESQCAKVTCRFNTIGALWFLFG